MNELFEVSEQIEQLVRTGQSGGEHLAGLVNVRQKLINELRDVPEPLARKLWSQNVRLIQTCEATRASLSMQLKQVGSKNQRRDQSQASSRYFDGHC